MSQKPASSDPTEALQAAIALAQSGDRDAARAQLLALTSANPSLELAWMWLATVTDDSQERIAVLRRVLAINPANDKARTALARLTGDMSNLPPAPKSAQRPSPKVVPSTNRRATNQNQSIELILFGILIVAVIIVLFGGGALLLSGRLQPTATPTITDTIAPTATKLAAPLKTNTPSITPGGPTETPYVVPTLPPTWTPAPSQTPPPSFTPIPTDTPIPTETTMPTIPPPSPVSIVTKSPTPTLVPLPTLPQTAEATKAA